MNAFIAQTDRPSLDLGERESIYQPENKDLIFPEIPEFKNVAQERHRVGPIEIRKLWVTDG